MSNQDSDALGREFAEYASIARVRAAIEGVMVTPTEVGSGFRAFDALTKAISWLREIGKKAENAEFVEAIADLTMKAAQANLELAGITNDLAQKTQENSVLQTRINELERWDISDFQIIEQGDLLYSELYKVYLCPSCLMKKIPEALSDKGVGRARAYTCSSCDFAKHVRV